MTEATIAAPAAQTIRIAAGRAMEGANRATALLGGLRSYYKAGCEEDDTDSTITEMIDAVSEIVSDIGELCEIKSQAEKMLAGESAVSIQHPAGATNEVLKKHPVEALGKTAESAVRQANLEMPKLFEIEETNPLFNAGNVYDGATEMVRYAEFLQYHFNLDEDDHAVRAAMFVLVDALRKHRDVLDNYHTAFTAWKESEVRHG